MQAEVTPARASQEPALGTFGSGAGIATGATTNQPQVVAAALKQAAVGLARTVADAFPNDALSYALLGSAYYNTGKSEEATKYLQRCLQLSPNQADAYEILARIAYEKGQLEESVRLSQEALQRGPASAEVLNGLGRALMDLGQLDAAIEPLHQATRLPRPTSESFYLLGQAHLQAGRHAQAKESFLRAVALVPDHTQAYFGLFTACLRLGQADEAARYREQFQKLEAVDRKTLTDRSAQEDTLTGLPLVRKTVARTFFGAGQIFRTHNEATKAADLFRRAAALDPEAPVYRSVLEGHYVQRNAVAEGITVFEQLVREQPESALNLYYLGRLQSRANRFEAAEQTLQQGMRLAPEWPEPIRALAELYLRAERKPVEARVLAQRLVQLQPSAGSYYLLAVACAKNEDRTAALAAAKQALTLNPKEKRYQELLQQLEAVR